MQQNLRKTCGDAMLHNAELSTTRSPLVPASNHLPETPFGWWKKLYPCRYGRASRCCVNVRQHQQEIQTYHGKSDEDTYKEGAQMFSLHLKSSFSNFVQHCYLDSDGRAGDVEGSFGVQVTV